MASLITQSESNRDLGWIRSGDPWSVSKVTKWLVEQTTKCMESNSTRNNRKTNETNGEINRIIKKRGGYIDEKKI